MKVHGLITSLLINCIALLKSSADSSLGPWMSGQVWISTAIQVSLFTRSFLKICTHRHTHTHTITHDYTHSYTHTHTLTHVLTQTQTHTHKYTQTHTHIITHTHAHKNKNKHTHIITLPIIHIYTHRHTCTHNHIRNNILKGFNGTFLLSFCKVYQSLFKYLSNITYLSNLPSKLSVHVCAPVENELTNSPLSGQRRPSYFDDFSLMEVNWEKMLQKIYQ